MWKVNVVEIARKLKAASKLREACRVREAREVKVREVRVLYIASPSANFSNLATVSGETC